MASKVSGVVEKIKTSGTSHAIASTAYGYCETKAATPAKVVDMTGFELNEGVTIHVKFANANTAASPTLNVNGKGAKPIVQYGTTAVSTADETNGWYAGAVVSFTYDGTSWVRDQGFNTNTWRGIVDNLTSSTNTTQSLSAKQGYLLANGSARDSTKLPLAGGTMTGNIRRYYSAASTEPMITMLSNNQDILLWEAGHGTAAATTTTYNHYKLLYKGTGSDSDNSNYLQLIAHKTNENDVVAVQIDEVGNVSLPQMNKGSATKPIYLNNGVITEGTALKDLAYIDKPTSNTTSVFLRGDGNWSNILNGNLNINTTADYSDYKLFVAGAAASSIHAYKIVNLTGQGQKTSYRRTVIALCKVSTTNNTEYNSYSMGKLFFHRTNGLYGAFIIELAIENQYSAANHFNYYTNGNLNLNSSMTKIGGKGYRPCTFLYNNELYGGIIYFVDNAETGQFEFVGYSNFLPFAIDYYSTYNNGTVLNQEIYDSINFDNADAKGNVFYANTFNGNLVGNATNVTGIVAIANGGTGKSNDAAINTVFAGPSSGDAGAPNWRKLVAADIPDLSWNKITSNKPTTISGYGITDAVLFSKISSGISSGSGAAETKAYWANNTYIPKNSIKMVYNTAGLEYTLLFSNNNNAYGTVLKWGYNDKYLRILRYHYSSGTQSDHWYSSDWEKISAGYADSVPWSGISSKPTTISGYGITDAASSTHVHGEITNNGKIGTTADLAVYTTTGGAITAGSLETAAPSASGNATAFITSVSQDSKGKITANKANLDTSGTWSGTANNADKVDGSHVINGDFLFKGSAQVTITGTDAHYIKITVTDGMYYGPMMRFYIVNNYNNIQGATLIEVYSREKKFLIKETGYNGNNIRGWFQPSENNNIYYLKVGGVTSGNGTVSIYCSANSITATEITSDSTDYTTVSNYGYTSLTNGAAIISSNLWQSIIPRGNNSYTLGNSTYKWKTVYATDLYGGGGNITLGTASRAVVTDSNNKLSTQNLSVTDSNASTDATTTFVQAVTQSATGKITVTKAALNTSGTWSGNAATATTLETGRTLKVSLGSTNASTAFNGSADITDIGVSGTLAIANGGTGKTSAQDAANALLSGLPTNWTATPLDDTTLIRCATDNAAAFGRVKFSTIWSYFDGKATSVGFTGTPTAPTAANGTNTTQIATTAFVNNTLSYINAMQFKGTIGTGGTITTLPASHNAGDTYRVITAGTYAGKYCEVGTLIICVADGTAAADADWTSVETNEDGAVIGPTSSTTNAIARFSSTSGRIIKDNSYATLDDNGHITITHKSGSDGEVRVKYSSTVDFALMIGSGDANHGIYDYKKSAWILYAGTDNQWSFVGNASTATKLSSNASNTTASFWRGDNTWSSTLTGSITISKAGECGLEVINSQATNPHKGFFGGGSSGNLGIYDRTYTKWIVYSNPSGNVVLNGNAVTATTLATARELYVDLSTTRNTDSKVKFDGSADKALHVSGTLPIAQGGTGATDAADARTNLGLGNVENQALSTWTGSQNITTVGTITSGTWNGTAIAAAYIGSHTHNYAGSASAGGPANTVKGAYTSNGGQQNPNYFGKNKVGFLMMNTKVNNNTQYKDWIIMDCYANNDVGGGVAFGVNRQSLGAYIMRSAAARETWAESAELVGTHNISTGDANGQIKLAGTNIDVKGLGSAAYTESTAYAAASHGTHVSYGTSTAKIGTASAGSATTVSRSDHVHAIDLATGDNNGQVKIAGTNVSVKGLGDRAFDSTNYVKYAGNLSSSVGQNSTAANVKTWWENTTNVPKVSMISAYNTNGTEWSFLFSKGNADKTYGSVLRWGYSTKYLYLLRKNNANSWISSDWEKISAGYADEAGSATTLTVTDISNTSTATALNNLKDAYKTYYAGGSNTVENNPAGAGNAFGLTVKRIASGYRLQDLITSSGVRYWRIWNNSEWGTWYNLLSSDNTAAGTNNNETLTWNATYTIAKINGTDIKFTTMAKPTYTASDVGALADNTVVTNVAISADTTTNKNYAIVFGTTPKDGTSPTAAKTEGLQKNSARLYFNPNSATLSISNGTTTGTLTATDYSGKAATAGTADTANAVTWANVGEKPLTLTKNTTGFSISGGTTSKTLTVNESITLNAGAASKLAWYSSANTISGTRNAYLIDESGDSVTNKRNELVLGNATAKASNGSSFGRLALYSPGTTGTYLVSAESSNGWFTATLPAKTGTIAYTSDIPTNLNQLTNGPGYTTNTGTVTSVQIQATAPLNSSSSDASSTTLSTTISFNAQVHNTVLAGPEATNAANAKPTFRSLVSADIPDLSSTYLKKADGGTIAGQLTISNAGSTQTMSTKGIQVLDVRNSEFNPKAIEKGANFYFSKTDTPGTTWYAGLYVHGWGETYAAWCLVGPADNAADNSTTPLYVRSSQDGTHWGSYRKIYDSSNKPTLEELGAAPSSTVSCTTANVKSALGASSNGSTTKWLNEQGSWSTPTAANVGALASGTVVTNVSYTAASDNNAYPILMKNSTGETTTAAGVKFNKNITINPSTSTITATNFAGNATTANSISVLKSDSFTTSASGWYTIASYNSVSSTTRGTLLFSIQTTGGDMSPGTCWIYLILTWSTSSMVDAQFYGSNAYVGGVRLTTDSGKTYVEVKFNSQMKSGSTIKVPKSFLSPMSNGSYTWYSGALTASAEGRTVGTEYLNKASSISVQGGIGAARFYGPLTGDVTGNATTAGKLANSVTIWGQSFDGSANISGNLIDAGPSIYLPSSATDPYAFKFLKSDSNAAKGCFGGIGINTSYSDVNFTNYVLDVKGASRLRTSLTVSTANTTTYNNNEVGSFIGPGTYSVYTTTKNNTELLSTNGYYLFSNAAQYGRLYIGKVGVASTTTTFTNPSNTSQRKTGYINGQNGEVYLTLGNDLVGGSNGSGYSSPGSASVANNAQGFLRLYSQVEGYADLTAYKGDATRIYPLKGFALPTNQVGLMFRPENGDYYTHFSYQNSGNEALVMATQKDVTSFIFINGESASNVSASRWSQFTGASGAGNAPGLQIKKNCVSIGQLVPHGTNPAYRLAVSGQTYLGNTTASTTTTLSAQAIVSNINGGNVAMELYRGTKTSWQIANDSGVLYLRDNYGSSTAGTTYNHTAISIGYNNTGITVSNSIIPGANNTYELGSTTNRWKTLYIESQSNCITNGIVFYTGTTVKARIGSNKSNGDFGIYGTNLLYLRPDLNDTSKGIEVRSSCVVPTTDLSVNLGVSTNRWSNIYGDTVKAKSYVINDSATPPVEKAHMQWNATDQSIDFIFA